LASNVIDTLGATRSLIFYYCDYADKRSLEPANVYGTLARQALEKVDVIPESLASEIEQAHHDGERLTDQSQALQILLRSIALFRYPLFLVLDGLDEMRESAQNLTYHGLSQLLNDSRRPVKLLLTSREELRPSFKINAGVPFLSILISPSAIALDIDSYVRASTRRRILDGLLVIRDSTLEETIVQELVKGAKGM
jgi:hypothetical protein